MIFLKKKNTWKYDVIFKCSEKIIFPKKNCTGIWYFLYHEENIICFLRTENERWYFSKNTWKYDVFCMLVRVVFLFPTNTKLHFCQKSKDDLFPKNTPKDDISGITEKDDINLRKDDIGILYTFMKIFLSVSIYCFPIKKPRKLNLYTVDIWLYL